MDIEIVVMDDHGTTEVKVSRPDAADALMAAASQLLAPRWSTVEARVQSLADQIAPSRRLVDRKLAGELVSALHVAAVQHCETAHRVNRTPSSPVWVALVDCRADECVERQALIGRAEVFLR